MRIKTRPIKGKGRGRLLGFPTINLAIPKNFSLKEGIYAAWVTIQNEKYKGALHFGPVPTFNEKEPTLEVYLINRKSSPLPPPISQLIVVEPIKKIREVKKFITVQDLVKQIEKDIKDALQYL